MVSIIGKAALIEQAAFAIVASEVTNHDVADPVEEFARDDVTAALPVIAKALLAPLRELHQPEERWHDGSGEWSVPREQWDMSDGKPEAFLICDHCGSIEMRESQGDSEHASYLDALWPCSTVRLLDQIESEVQA